ncbi:MAG TPA: alpha/beta hydrolase-fold protein [Actinoplanes sp.]|nr:alpha/beta hydrolase-fold protein [Actinoplanes sp.]
MSPDSLAVELLAAAAAVAAAIVLATVGGATTIRRVVLRSAALLACLATAAAAGLLWVNRQVDAYPTWSSLFGTEVPTTVPAGATPAGAGRIVSFTVPGTASGLTLPMYAYLPPGYADNSTTRYPVIEALHGFPASPLQWLDRLEALTVLDHEIAAHRMAPTVVLFPYVTPDVAVDTECTNIVRGPHAETFLTRDVPAFARAHLRIRAGDGWGLIGYSAGAYCATQLLLRHPGRYAAAASLSGYAQPGIAVGDGTEHTTYNAAWRLTHLPIPAVALYLACARTDRKAMRGTRELAGLARYPISLTTAFVGGGGHNTRTWVAMEPAAFDWLSTWLGRPANAV